MIHGYGSKLGTPNKFMVDTKPILKSLVPSGAWMAWPIPICHVFSWGCCLGFPAILGWLCFFSAHLSQSDCKQGLHFGEISLRSSCAVTMIGFFFHYLEVTSCTINFFWQKWEQRLICLWTSLWPVSHTTSYVFVFCSRKCMIATNQHITIGVTAT